MDLDRVDKTESLPHSVDLSESEKEISCITAQPALIRSVRIMELDSLRGIAAITVLLYHYTSIYPRLIAHRDFSIVPHFDFGYFGVELFFMISGFVIFFSAERSRSVKEFAASRFCRLFPAYWGSILITAVIEIAGYHNSTWSLLWISIINFTMLQTFFGIRSLDPAYWTLSYELCFYVLITSALRLTAARGQRIEIALLGWLAVASIARGIGIQIPYRLSIALMLNYGQFFVFGVAFFIIHSRKADFRTYLAAGWSLLLSTFGADPHTPASGFNNYFICSSVCAIIMVISVELKPKFLANSALMFFGRISYSLYLTHGTIGFFVIDRVLMAGGSDLLAVLSATTFSIFIGYLLNVTVEVPIRIVFTRWLGLRRSIIPSVA